MLTAHPPCSVFRHLVDLALPSLPARNKSSLLLQQGWCGAGFGTRTITDLFNPVFWPLLGGFYQPIGPVRAPGSGPLPTIGGHWSPRPAIPQSVAGFFLLFFFVSLFWPASVLGDWCCLQRPHSGTTRNARTHRSDRESPPPPQKKQRRAIPPPAALGPPCHRLTLFRLTR